VKRLPGTHEVYCYISVHSVGVKELGSDLEKIKMEQDTQIEKSVDPDF
jgi:hypothetical protein